MKIYKILLVLIIAGLGIYFGGQQFSKVYKTTDEKGVVVQSSKSELEKIMDEENFKKETILRARKVANDNKKAVEIERNKKALDLIEAEYESIRAEELLLAGTNSSLK